MEQHTRQVQGTEGKATWFQPEQWTIIMHNINSDQRTLVLHETSCSGVQPTASGRDTAKMGVFSFLYHIWNPVHLDRIGQIGTYWYVPVRTGTTRYKAAVRESHGRTYWYVPIHTSTYTQEDKLFPDSSRKSQKR